MLIPNWTIHDSPDEAVKERLQSLAKIKKAKGERAYKSMLRHIILTDPWFMMRVVFDWGFLDEELVGRQLLLHLKNDPTLDKVIALPRGHGKTLPMTAILINILLNFPDAAIMMVARTENNAVMFGDTIGQHLTSNPILQDIFGTQNEEGGILPVSKSETTLWGKDGYNLPSRKPRRDPSLLCVSIGTSVTGLHPDLIYVDDPTEATNNNPTGWSNVISWMNNAKLLLPPQGFMIWSGTTWADGDPLSLAFQGKLKGKQGPFKVLRRSCYIDDNPSKGVIYPKKKRWNMVHETGYTVEALDNMRAPQSEGGMGQFFNAQMRNDPAPIDEAEIDINQIIIYNQSQLPKLEDKVRLVGIEADGPGLVLYSGLDEKCRGLKIPMPLTTYNQPRKANMTKADHIKGALQPIIQSGKLYIKEWMLGDGISNDTLGYELSRLGAAAHDDIADALRSIVVHLIGGSKPAENEPARVYIGTDLAYTEKARSDFTVIMAVAMDNKGNYWVLDYDRFQSSSPSTIHDRIIQFTRKYDSVGTNNNSHKKRKFMGSWR